MLLNAAWLLVVQQGWLWASVGVIVALLAVLAVLVKRLSTEPAGSTAEKVVVDATFGLYLGWVCVATAANVAATIAAEGIEPVRAVSEGIAALVLLFVGAVGVMLAVVLGGRIAVTSAIAWGLGWIAVGRTTASPDSTVTAITAGAVAVLIVAATVAARLRGRPLSTAGEASFPGPRSRVRRRGA
jgi:hypothetical protein